MRESIWIIIASTILTLYSFSDRITGILFLVNCASRGCSVDRTLSTNSIVLRTNWIYYVQIGTHCLQNWILLLALVGWYFYSVRKGASWPPGFITLFRWRVGGVAECGGMWDEVGGVGGVWVWERGRCHDSWICYFHSGRFLDLLGFVRGAFRSAAWLRFISSRDSSGFHRGKPLHLEGASIRYKCTRWNHGKSVKLPQCLVLACSCQSQSMPFSLLWFIFFIIQIFPII